MRRTVIVLIAVLLTGAIPAAAAMATCSPHSCCEKPAQRLTPPAPSCCSISQQRSDRAVYVPRRDSGPRLQLLSTNLSPIPASIATLSPIRPQRPLDASPPRSAGERIATLSTYLI